MRDMKLSNINEVVEREKQWHNAASTANPRENIYKFYSITKKQSEYHLNAVLKHCNSKGRILDYGCGSGRFSQRLISDGDIFRSESTICKDEIYNGFEIDGIDISEERIQQARSLALANTNFNVMDAMNTNFEDQTFDCITGSAILHHLDIELALKEINRILKKDEGIAVFTEPLGTNPFINLFRKATPKQRTEDEHPLSRKDFLLFEKYFENVKIECFNFFTLLAVPLRKTRNFENILAKLNTLDQYFFKYIPFSKKLAWSCVCVMAKPRNLK